MAILLMLVIFQLSLSTIFSKNLWTFLAVIKIIFIIAETFFEIISKEKLLTMHIGSADGKNFIIITLFKIIMKYILFILIIFYFIVLALGFATFGAIDFLDFLKGYLMGLCKKNIIFIK